MSDTRSSAGQPGGAGRASSREVFTGRLITVRVETQPKPIGGTRDFEIVEHPDAVAIVALQNGEAGGEPRVALVRQPRPAIGRETWELPAGLMKPDEEDPQRAAERELREEIGYAATTWRRLIREYPSPGFSTEAITLYLATDLRPAPPDEAGQDADGPDEVDAVDWIPLGEAVARCQRGEIDDGKTALGLTLAAATLGPGVGASGARGSGSGRGEEARGGTTMPQENVTLVTGHAPEPTLYGQLAPQAGVDDSLKLDGLLLAEFDYASNSAHQAMEDRTRTFNLYLVLVGVLASALVALYQVGSLKALTQPLSILLLAAGGILGLVFFVQLIRLRQAHQECVITMNMIKEYYLKRIGQERPDVGTVFRWRLATMKTGERLGSVTFLVCFTVALLDGMALASAAMVAYQLTSGTEAIDPLTPATYLTVGIVGLAILVVVVLLQIVYYRFALRSSREQAQIQQAQARVAEALAAPSAQSPIPVGARASR